MQVARGELIVTHRQNGPGNSKRTSVGVGPEVSSVIPLQRIGVPAEMTATRIPFSQPARYVEFKCYAGGGVGREQEQDGHREERKRRREQHRSCAV